jgi:hypothetical protein
VKKAELKVDLTAVSMAVSMVGSKDYYLVE